MTINPTDNQLTWTFSTSLWYEGEFGEAFSGMDYINDTLRHIPIKAIMITSTKDNHTAVKIWELKANLKGKTFQEILNSCDSDRISKSNPTFENIPHGFDYDPIMKYSGPLMLNFVHLDNGVRILLPSQEKKYKDGEAYGLGVGYRLGSGVLDDSNSG